MEIVIVEDIISIKDLKRIAKVFYGDMIKGVVDIKKEIVAFGGEYHIDANMKLIEHGSLQKDIWGFNIEFSRPKKDWIEYISLINIRPLEGNRDMEVQNESIRKKMKKIINSKIQ